MALGWVLHICDRRTQKFQSESRPITSQRARNQDENRDEAFLLS